MNDYEMGWNAALDVAIAMLRSPLLRRDVSLSELADHLRRMQVREPSLREAVAQFARRPQPPKDGGNTDWRWRM